MINDSAISSFFLLNKPMFDFLDLIPVLVSAVSQDDNIIMFRIFKDITQLLIIAVSRGGSRYLIYPFHVKLKFHIRGMRHADTKMEQHVNRSARFHMSGCGMRFVLRLRTDADTAN